MNKLNTSKQNIQKLLKESAKAVSTVLKNKEIIETLISIQEIKGGNYKRFSSAEDMFQKFSI